MKTLTDSFTAPKYFLAFFGISLFSIIFSLFTPIWVQNLVAIVGILSFGILHGANDLKIIAKKTRQKEGATGFNFFVLYIGVVLLGIVLFFFIPKIALLSFVLVSCYHFGEQHWSGRSLDLLNPFVFYFSYGAIVFFSLFTFQYEQSAEIILQISGVRLPFQFFWIGLVVSFLAFLLCLILSKKNLTHYLLELGLLVVLAFLFSNASLLFGFGLYFVLWHSIPSLNSQLKYIYKASTRNSLVQYLKAAALYWILALAGMLLFYYFVRVPEDQYLSIFFSLLAAITFPHAVVMGLMFHSKDSNEE